MILPCIWYFVLNEQLAKVTTLHTGIQRQTQLPWAVGCHWRLAVWRWGYGEASGSLFKYPRVGNSVPDES